jgi:ATP-binding cassette subfamily F protein 3
VREFDGDLDDYARWLVRGGSLDTADMREASGKPAPSPATAAVDRATPRVDPQQRRKEGAEARKALAPLRSRLTRCEKRLEELAVQARELDVQLADPALYAAGARQRQLDLNASRARIALEIEQVEAEWL